MVFRSTVSVQNWIVDFDATQVRVDIFRLTIQVVVGVWFIKVSIMPLWELKVTSELNFKNC